MKVKNGFMLREVTSNFFVVPVGQTAVEFNGIITLSETGAFLWKQLAMEASSESMIVSLLDAYDISREIAEKDTLEFIESVRNADLLE